MINIKKFLIIVLAIITFGIAYKYYKKYKDVEKLKIGDTSLHSTKKISNIEDLVDVFKNGLLIKGFIEIRNFSGKDYVLNQISIDAFTPSTEKLIATQTNIIKNNITLKNKQSTNIPIEYKIDIIKTLSLFKESAVIPKDTTLWKVITHPAQYLNKIELKKLKIKLKGFIEAEGITLDINQEYFLYE